MCGPVAYFNSFRKFLIRYNSHQFVILLQKYRLLICMIYINTNVIEYKTKGRSITYNLAFQLHSISMEDTKYPFRTQRRIFSKFSQNCDFKIRIGSIKKISYERMSW